MLKTGMLKVMLAYDHQGLIYEELIDAKFSSLS